MGFSCKQAGAGSRLFRKTRQNRWLPAIHALTLLALAAGAQQKPSNTAAASDASTPPEPPQLVESNEADKVQIRLAREQGQAVGKEVEWLLNHAAAKGERIAGNYNIAFALSAPEGWYEPGGGQLNWREPGEAGAHLRVVVRDGTEGRSIPFLAVRAALSDASGQSPALKPLPYGWYPLANGYGDNIRLTGAGPYRLRVEIDPPRFRRHDPYNGDRFTKPTVAEFNNITLDPAALVHQTPLCEQDVDAQIALAKGEGDAYARTLKAMFKQANDGKIQPSGDYKVINAIEYAEAYWHYHGSHFEYTNNVEYSAEKNCHVEISAQDALTGRFVPVPNVTATLYDKNRQVASQTEPFMWHPWLYHFGENARVPHSGKYRILAHFDAPAWRRYGRTVGKRFTEPVSVEFTEVKIESGQK